MKIFVSLAYAGIGHVLITEVVILKNKFQRIGAFICSGLIVCLFTCCFLISSVSAALISHDGPYMVAFVQNTDYGDEPWQYELSGGALVAPTVAYTDLVGIAWFPDGYEEEDVSLERGLYGFFESGPDVLNFNNYPVVYVSGPDLDISMMPGSIPMTFSSPLYLKSLPVTSAPLDINMGFVSNGQSFTSISLRPNSLSFVSDSGSVEVASRQSALSPWVYNEEYRVIFFDGFITPTTYSEAQFFRNQFEPYVAPSFLDRVSSGLTAVIGWVGVVISAVISGPLSPLLGLVAVGIAVSAILIVIYLVRRFIWGA